MAYTCSVDGPGRQALALSVGLRIKRIENESVCCHFGGLFSPSVWGIETSDKYDKYDKKILEKYIINFILGEGAAPLLPAPLGEGGPSAEKSIIFISFVRCGVPHIKAGTWVRKP